MPPLTIIRSYLPIIVALTLCIVSAMPIHIAGAAAFFPIVDVMSIYYWSSYRPQSMPDWFVFILGIMRDMIEGLSIGTSPCIYLLVRFAVVSIRAMYRRQNFILIWQGFAIAAMLALIGKWLLVSFVIDKPIAFTSAIMQFVFSIAMYPVFHWLFNLVNSLMPEHTQNA